MATFDVPRNTCLVLPVTAEVRGHGASLSGDSALRFKTNLLSLGNLGSDLVLILERLIDKGTGLASATSANQLERLSPFLSKKTKTKRKRQYDNKHRILVTRRE